MGCFDCVCENYYGYSNECYCQLSTLDTFNNNEDEGWDCYRGDCCFYNSCRKDFVDNILRINKHKGDDIDFSNIKAVDFDIDCRACCVFHLKKDMYIKDFEELLKKQDFWEDDKEFFESVRNKKIEDIEFYGDKEIGINICAYDTFDEIIISEKDNEKFELLQALSFRSDNKKLKEILMYME